MDRSRLKKTFPVLTIGAAAAAGGAAFIWFTRRRLAVPMRVTELDVAAGAAMPQAIPPDALDGETPVQLLTKGAGPLYVRSYQADIAHPTVDRETLMQRIIEDINTYSPEELAHFEKTKGDEAKMEVGDEFFITITGPWNGPVRVIDVTPTSFTFVTLEGHLEAGEIRFSLLEHPERDDAIRFRIQSWARSSNLLTDLFYRTIGVSRFAQTTMWSYFVQQVIKASGGEMLDEIAVMTHKVDIQRAMQQIPAWKLYANQFERWGKTDYNFDINRTEEFTEANGWRLDDYSIGLPGEPPGEPLPNGSFAAAKNVVKNYEFPDPALISGIFLPEGDLKDRVMILRARFWFFQFLFGVRIGSVIDEVRETEKQGKATVWGYSYRTLQGHFEMGEITFEVWKYHETGEVRFRVHAYSKPDRIPNPFYRIGFRIFGRSLQVRFARTATERMQQLVLERLAPPKDDADKVETPEVASIEEDAAVQEKADEAEGEQPER